MCSCRCPGAQASLSRVLRNGFASLRVMARSSRERDSSILKRACLTSLSGSRGGRFVTVRGHGAVVETVGRGYSKTARTGVQLTGGRVIVRGELAAWILENRAVCLMGLWG